MFWLIIDINDGAKKLTRTRATFVVWAVLNARAWTRLPTTCTVARCFCWRELLDEPATNEYRSNNDYANDKYCIEHYDPLKVLTWVSGRTRE